MTKMVQLSGKVLRYHDKNLPKSNYKSARNKLKNKTKQKAPAKKQKLIAKKM